MIYTVRNILHYHTIFIPFNKYRHEVELAVFSLFTNNVTGAGVINRSFCLFADSQNVLKAVVCYKHRRDFFLALDNCLDFAKKKTISLQSAVVVVHAGICIKNIVLHVLMSKQCFIFQENSASDLFYCLDLKLYLYICAEYST